MRAEYTLEAVAVCPADNKPDIYTVTVRATRTIPAEEILAVAESMKGKPMYQEAFTAEMHRILAAEVETLGWHSGVRTRVIVGGGGW